MDNPRVLLFIVLSFLFLLIWQAWMEDYGPAPQTAAEANGQQASTRPQQAADNEDLPSHTPAVTAAADTPEVGGSAALGSGRRIDVRTDLVRAEIDSRGGDLRILDLLDYPETTDPDSPPYRLLNDRGSDLFVAQSGLRSTAGDEPTHHAEFHIDQPRYQMADDQDTLEVPLRWRSADGVQVTKLYRFHRGSYVVDVEYHIENNSASPWSGRPYNQFQRSKPAAKNGSQFIHTYTGGVIYSPEDKYQKISFEDMQEGDLSREISDGWTAMIQHYFLAAWIPESDQPQHYYTRALRDGRYVIGLIGQPVAVAAGEQRRLSTRLYAGPKLQDHLAEVAPGLELTVDYGLLTFISEPLFWLLQKLHALLGNWGWAIVVLTMLIKLAFFKLSETSYKSMANMRKLAPRLQALKERYGDDKQRLNQAMMELYKTEKINPLGGCLPVLVQIPVFIALYWVLLESVELRQAPFILWIQDLSSADPYFVLPLVMGVTMLIQQKLNPAPMDPIQAKVMMILPVVFTVFFAFFPAGLVLYWVVNNTLSIAQQWVITKRVEEGR